MIIDLSGNNAGGGASIIGTTYAALKSLRDGGNLVAGQLYRITDYHCTTTQANTHSADHQFDIIVLALDASHLSEEAWAAVHEGDTYFTEAGANLSAWKIWYCLDDPDGRFAWAQEGKDLPAWITSDDILGGEHLEYQGQVIIDGDIYYKYGTQEQAERYYAEDGWLGWVLLDAIHRAPATEVVVLSESSMLAIYNSDGTDEAMQVYSMSNEKATIVPLGTGVIYRMIDEWNNDCPYDFKNIQFKRKLTNGEYDRDGGTDTWVYTFHGNVYNLDDSIIRSNVDISVYNAALSAYTTDTDDENGMAGCYRNVIKPCGNYRGDDWIWGKGYSLNDNVFFGSWYEGTEDEWAHSKSPHCNYLGDNCYLNTFDGNCYSNTFGNYCKSNTFGDRCISNTFGNECSNNTFGDSCAYNTFSNACYSNTFGNGCKNKHLEHTIGKTSGISGYTAEYWFNGSKKW